MNKNQHPQAQRKAQTYHNHPLHAQSQSQKIHQRSTQSSTPYGLTPESNNEKWKSFAWQVLMVGTFAGLVLLPKCKDAPARRPVYSSLEQCMLDWGAQAADCERVDLSPEEAATLTRSQSVGNSNQPFATRRWYGPDIDEQGQVYHADGSITQDHKTLATLSFRASSITRSGFTCKSRRSGG